jgi:predicted amidohydrolase
MCRGGSAIVSPLGEVVAGPLYDQEGILTAELDRVRSCGPRWTLTWWAITPGQTCCG